MKMDGGKTLRKEVTLRRDPNITFKKILSLTLVQVKMMVSKSGSVEQR